MALTCEEIQAVITNKLQHKNFIIESSTYVNPDDVWGFFGNHLRVNVIVAINDDVEEFNFFCKFFPRDNNTADFVRITGAFKKEIFAYTIFNDIIKSGVDLLRDCITDCFYFQADKVIVMNDLQQNGFYNKTLRDIDITTVKVIIKTLAKFHASSIIYEEKTSKTHGKNYRIIDDYKQDFKETLYNDKEGFINVPGVQSSLRGLLTEIDLFNLNQRKLASGKDFKQTVIDLSKALYELVKPSKKYRNVISHGDLWTNNFLIKYDNEEPYACKFIDFQYLRYVPPSHDLLSLLFLTTSRSFRYKHFQETLELYYKVLGEFVSSYGINLNDTITFENFMDSCKEQKLFAILQSATYFQIILADAELTKKLNGDKKLYDKCMKEDKSFFILENIEVSETYKNKLEETILDLRDYCDTFI